MSKELYEQVSEVANSDFEENKDKFIRLQPKDIFIFSYVHGFREAFTAYVSDNNDDMSEFQIGDIVTEVQTDVLNNSISGAEKEILKYDDRVKSMKLKEVYILGFQSGFQCGFETYSDKDFNRKDIQEPFKYYHANFERLH